MRLDRLRRPGWLIVGAALLGGLVWFGGPALFRQLDFFRVRRIEVVGLRYLPPEAVVDRIPLTEGANLFDDLTPLAESVRAVPGLQAVTVRRRPPGTVRITVAEVSPVALAPADGRLAPVAADGTVLPYDPARAAPDLPVAESRDTVLTRLLGLVREVDPALYAAVSTAGRIRGDVILEADGRRLWFRADATAEVIRAVMVVAADLARSGRPYRELDGRFDGVVVVRKVAA